MLDLTKLPIFRKPMAVDYLVDDRGVLTGQGHFAVADTETGKILSYGRTKKQVVTHGLKEYLLMLMDSRMASVNWTDTGGTVRAITPSQAYPTAQAGSLYLYVGSGVTAPTVNDVAMQTAVDNFQSGAVSLTTGSNPTLNVSGSKIYAGANFTAAELGLVTNGRRGSADVNFYNWLCDRSALAPTPAVVTGQTIAIAYALQFT